VAIARQTGDSIIGVFGTNNENNIVIDKLIYEKLNHSFIHKISLIKLIGIKLDEII